jgi:hypothetical protein
MRAIAAVFTATLLLLASIAPAQTNGAVGGKVVGTDWSQEEAHPIVGAWVVLTGGSGIPVHRETVTGAGGEFQLFGIPSGDGYTLHVESEHLGQVDRKIGHIYAGQRKYLSVWLAGPRFYCPGLINWVKDVSPPGTYSSPIPEPIYFICLD